MIRLGLCCLFVREPIRFRSLTAKGLLTQAVAARREKIFTVCLSNSEALLSAVDAVRRLGIGAFRITSTLFPRYTHPDVGYTIKDLPGSELITMRLATVKKYAATHDIRLSFHPDQFVVLSSPRREVVEKSLLELDYQALVAALVGADAINLHAGGAYGDKQATLTRLRKTIDHLPDAVRCRLTLENDDVTYTPSDLLPVCRDTEIPLVYDVHHHRCNPDDLGVEDATEAALGTWQRTGREPLFHISTPRDGWMASDRRPHHDYIDPQDFPECWMNLRCTVDIEAKAKELAILKLRDQLLRKGVELWSP